jgi:hypothetical protein
VPELVALAGARVRTFLGLTVGVRVTGARISVALGLLAAGCGTASHDDVSRRPPRLVRLSDGGPAFVNYDGNAGQSSLGRDWPVSLIFAGNASIANVKSALRRAGLTRTGLTNYLAYRVGSRALRLDGDRGLKTPCDAAGTDLHVRLYAPGPKNRFIDPKFGSVVVGTTHLDHADGCSAPPTVFGFSELAERRVASLLARRGWRVQVDRLPLGNAEPYRRAVSDPAHVWWSDGRATLITVP